MKKIFKIPTEYLIVIFVIAFFYLPFPTQNSTQDAYSYAADIKYGNHLFSPHHPLYNAFMYLVIKPLLFIIPQADVLTFLKWINSLFIFGSLLILNGILKNLNWKLSERILGLLFVAFSFNVWRFGTENETYIIPLFISLTGSYYFILYTNSKHWKWAVLSGIFASLSCLFHQIHLFWWIGLAVGFWSIKDSRSNHFLV